MKAFEVDLPGARAVFSTRQGGVSEPPYDTLNLDRFFSHRRDGGVTGRQSGVVVRT